ncbi:MAG TPA: outer membrane beta-barrel protein [Thiolinea sp.]|nr:outer membrane beta-barrel protein [Thiolinea sp.]
MKTAYLSLSLLCLPLIASAETDWYGVISLGKTIESPKLTEANEQGTIDYPLDEEGDSGDSSGTTLKNLAVGYHLNKHTAVELEWQYRPWKAQYASHSYFDEFNSKNNAFLVNGVYQIPIQNQIKVYAKGSLGLAQHRNANSGDQPGFFYPAKSKMTPALGLGVGIKLDISKNLGLGLEYRYMDLGKVSNLRPVNSKLSFDLKATELTGNLYIGF